MKTLIRITSSYFCAGIEVEDQHVVNTAPILKYMNGWSMSQVIDYVKKNLWTLKVVEKWSEL